VELVDQHVAAALLDAEAPAQHEIADADTLHLGEQRRAQRRLGHQLLEATTHARRVERDAILRVELRQHVHERRQLVATSRPQRQRMLPATHACVSRNASSCASSQISIPSSCALASLEPAASPATTRCVFFDTLPATLAPSASSCSPASSRLIADRLPVSTTVLPSSGPAVCSIRTG